MAEQTNNLNIAIEAQTAGGASSVGNVAFLSNDLDPYCGIEIPILSAAAITFSSIPKYVYIRNQGDFGISIDAVNTFNAFPQHISPGRAIVISPEATTIYAQSDGDTTQIYVLADTSITPPLPPGDIFILFRINIHDSNDLNDQTNIIEIGKIDDSNYFAVFPSSTLWGFYAQYSGNETDVTSPAPTLDTWFELGINIQLLLTGNAVVIPRVNGVDYASFDGGVWDGVIEKIRFGSIFNGFANRELDDLTIGTTGYGSSDIFSCDFSSSIAPPFTRIIGSGLDISTGTLAVNTVSDETYAEWLSTGPIVNPMALDSELGLLELINFSVPTVYIQFQVKFDAVEIAPADFGADMLDLYNDAAASNDYFGIAPDFSSPTKWWIFSNNTVTVTLPIVADTWYTIGIKIEWVGVDEDQFNGQTVYTPRIDGVDYPAVHNNGGVALQSLTLGGLFTGGYHIKRYFDNFTIGTSGFGSSEIFSADFASAVVPPFDSTTGTGISISSGTMLVDNNGGNAWATKAISIMPGGP